MSKTGGHSKEEHVKDEDEADRAGHQREHTAWQEIAP